MLLTTIFATESSGRRWYVHNRMGPCLREAHYHRALGERLRDLGIQVEAEYPVGVLFDDRPVGLLCLDCLVEDEVVVGLEAFPHLLTKEETAQVITNLAASGKSVGLLFNFGRKRLEFKRIFPPKTADEWQGRIERYPWRPAETRAWREEKEL